MATGVTPARRRHARPTLPGAGSADAGRLLRCANSAIVVGMSEHALSEAHAPDMKARAERLKERIYLTFTALAVIVALRGHGEIEPTEALITLALTIGGTLLAILVADVISHLAIHRRLMTAQEARHAFTVSFGALGALALPIVFIGLAVADIWPIDRALRASTTALLAALIVIGYLAIRRVPLTWWQRLIALTATAVLGGLVILLETLAHG